MLLSPLYNLNSVENHVYTEYHLTSAVVRLSFNIMEQWHELTQWIGEEARVGQAFTCLSLGFKQNLEDA